MADDQHMQLQYLAHGKPAFFTIHQPVKAEGDERVIKDCDRKLKIDFVLGIIGLVLPLIPCKFHDAKVYTKTYLVKMLLKNRLTSDKVL